MESTHCGQNKRIFFCPVHNASTQCSLKAFGIRCMRVQRVFLTGEKHNAHGDDSMSLSECYSAISLLNHATNMYTFSLKH